VGAVRLSSASSTPDLILTTLSIKAGRPQPLGLFVWFDPENWLAPNRRSLQTVKPAQDAGL